MLRLPITLIVLTLSCVGMSITTLGQNTRISLGTPTILQLNSPVERTIGPAQAHVFAVNVDEPSLIRLVVEQRGIDIVIRVTGPTGNNLGQFDSPNGDGGPENVSVVAPAKGQYHITVLPLNGTGDAREGKYEIKLLELRAATDEELKSSKNLEVLKLRGIELLNDIETAIQQIRAADNRIRLKLQVAKLLIQTDEKRALKSLNDAIVDLKELLTSIQTTSDDYSSDYMNAKQLRIDVFEVVSGHDPEMALAFMRATRPLMHPDNGQRNMDNEESTLEVILANRISASDPKRAMQLAEETLKTSYSPSLVQTVGRLRGKTPELASQLAKKIADKLLGEKLLRSSEIAQLTMNLLRLNQGMRRDQGPQSKTSTATAILDEADSRALCQKALNELNASGPTGPDSRGRDATWTLLQGLKDLGPELETMFPGSGATIDKKLAAFTTGMDPQQAALQQLQQTINSSSVDASLESVAKAPREMREQLYHQIAMRAVIAGDFARGRQILTDNIANDFQRQQALNSLEQQVMFISMQKGKFDEAIRSVSNRKNSKERASLVTQIASQLGPGQKKATAVAVLEQLRALIGPSVQADDQESITALFEIGRAFSRYDVGRAFEVVEPLVDQFNELGMAARTLNGFGQQYYKDGELIMQNGNSIANVATQMSIAIGTLALGNFDRAKETADKIRLPEIRIEAYLQIAQQTTKTN